MNAIERAPGFLDQSNGLFLDRVVSRACVLLVCCFVFSFGSRAATESMSTEEIRGLQQRMKGLESLSVDFVQIRTVSIRAGKKSKSSGHAVFGRPTKFRWELTKPVHDVMVFDGSVLYSFKPEEKTATRFQTQGDRTQEIKEVIDLVLDFDALLKRYELLSTVKDRDIAIMTLRPKQQGLIEGLEVYISTKTALISGIKMSFSNKNTTEYEFTNSSRDKTPDSKFTVPSGYKIVDGT